MGKDSLLLQPLKVGQLTLKNRIFMPPISTNLANKGYIRDESVAHYEARAKGGVGLIVSEVVMYIYHQLKDVETLVFANGYHIDHSIEEMLKAAQVSYDLIGDGNKVGNMKDF